MTQGSLIKKIIFLVVFFSFFLAGAAVLYAAQRGNAPQVVKGIIQENRYPSIMVNDKYYDIGHAPIIFRGSEVGASALERGKWVRLTVQDGRVVNVEIIDRPAAG